MIKAMHAFPLLLTLGVFVACADAPHEDSRGTTPGSLLAEENSHELTKASPKPEAPCAPIAPPPKPHYASPALVNPVKVFIGKDRTGGNFPEKDVDYFAGPKQIWPEEIAIQLNPGIKGQVGQKLLHFPYWVDVEVTIQTPMTVTSTIRILGGRNVVVRGQGCGGITKELNPDMPKECPAFDFRCEANLRDRIHHYTTLNTVLAVESQQLSATVENLRINVNGDFTDGIGLRQNPAYYWRQPASIKRTFRGVDVFIRNVTIEGIGGNLLSRHHGDMVQLQSGRYRNLFFENFSGTTGYQGLFLPNRREGHKSLCEESDKTACERSPNTTLSMIPMTVSGTAFLRNVTLRPYTCAHCVRPYIGLYTADPAEGEEPYKVVLNNVTFFRDPLHRSAVNEYIVPKPAFNTAEGLINMDKQGAGYIRGDLRIETEKKK